MTCTRCNHTTCKRFGLRQAQNPALALHLLPCDLCRSQCTKLLGTHYTSPEIAAKALTLMLEGMSIRAISRVTGLHKTTILSLLETVGQNCRKLWDTRLRGMRTQFVQAGEIWTYVGCHERRLP